MGANKCCCCCSFCGSLATMAFGWSSLLCALTLTASAAAQNIQPLPNYVSSNNVESTFDHEINQVFFDQSINQVNPFLSSSSRPNVNLQRFRPEDAQQDQQFLPPSSVENSLVETFPDNQQSSFEAPSSSGPPVNENQPLPGISGFFSTNTFNTERPSNANLPETSPAAALPVSTAVNTPLPFPVIPSVALPVNTPVAFLSGNQATLATENPSEQLPENVSLSFPASSIPAPVEINTQAPFQLNTAAAFVTTSGTSQVSVLPAQVNTPIPPANTQVPFQTSTLVNLPVTPPIAFQITTPGQLNTPAPFQANTPVRMNVPTQGEGNTQAPFQVSTTPGPVNNSPVQLQANIPVQANTPAPFQAFPIATPVPGSFQVSTPVPVNTPVPFQANTPLPVNAPVSTSTQTSLPANSPLPFQANNPPQVNTPLPFQANPPIPIQVNTPANLPISPLTNIAPTTSAPTPPTALTTIGVPNDNAGSPSARNAPALDPLAECYARSCDQVVSGRGLSYSRALQVVQEEEYLSQADLSVIRRNGGFNSQDYDYFGLEEEDTLILHREKRQFVGFNVTAPIGLAALGPPLLAGALLTGLLLNQLNNQANQQPNTPRLPPVLSVQPPPGYAPPNQPQPGTVGGGGLPVASSVLAAEALALVPTGLAAVAVFPPFSTPRTVNAGCVIYSEADDLYEDLPVAVGQGSYGHGAVPRYKRQTRGRRRQSSILDPFRSIKDRLQKSFQSFRRGRQRDRDHSRKGKGRYHHQSSPVSYEPKRQFKVVQRLYGFGCNVKIVENQPCVLGSTCDDQGNKIEGGFSRRRLDSVFAKRQTGEEFSSEAPPDCRTQFVGCSPR